MDRQTLTDWAERQTVKQAIQHLRSLGHVDILIFYQGAQMEISALLDLDRVYWRLASAVEIGFMGGPPNRVTLWKGSVKALLLDRAFNFLLSSGSMPHLMRLLKIQ